MRSALVWWWIVPHILMTDEMFCPAIAPTAAAVHVDRVVPIFPHKSPLRSHYSDVPFAISVRVLHTFCAHPFPLISFEHFYLRSLFTFLRLKFALSSKFQKKKSPLQCAENKR